MPKEKDKILYLDIANREVFISTGISEDEFGVYRRKPTGSLQRVIPIKTSSDRQQVEFALDAYAIKMGWKPVDIRGCFLRHIHKVIAYWSEQPVSEAKKMRGLAFSILAALDGECPLLPPFAIRPIDENGGEGENINIFKMLHDDFHVSSMSKEEKMKGGEVNEES